MIWSRVRAELARNPNYPAGTSRHHYEFILPLDNDGRLDLRSYEAAPKLCTVHGFREGEGDATGEIVRIGSDRWVFSWAPDGEYDEPILGFAERLFREDEYLTVRTNGADHTYRIVLVEPAPGLAHMRPR